MARACQVKALKRGCNVASVFLCTDSTFKDFEAVKETERPSNHITINIDGVPVAEVGKRIVRWLCEYSPPQPRKSNPRRLTRIITFGFRFHANSVLP